GAVRVVPPNLLQRSLLEAVLKEDARQTPVRESARVDSESLHLSVLDLYRRPGVARQTVGVLTEGDASGLAARRQRGEVMVMGDEPYAPANLNEIGVELRRRQRTRPIPGLQPYEC